MVKSLGGVKKKEIGDKMNDSEFKDFLYRNGLVDSFLKENGYICAEQDNNISSYEGQNSTWLFLENQAVPILARFEITPLSFTILRDYYCESSKSFASRELVKYSTEWQKYLAKHTGNYMDCVSQYIFQKCNEIEEEDCYKRDEILNYLEILRIDEDNRRQSAEYGMNADGYRETGRYANASRKPLGDKNRFKLLQKIEKELSCVTIKKQNNLEQ